MKTDRFMSALFAFNEACAREGLEVLAVRVTTMGGAFVESGSVALNNGQRIELSIPLHMWDELSQSVTRIK